MTPDRGMFYVFHGEQEFLRSEEVLRLRRQVVQDGMGDLNITTLDGRTATVSMLMESCNTVPFLTDRRLVIIENMLQRLEGRRRKGRGRPGARGGAAGGGDDDAAAADDAEPAAPGAGAPSAAAAADLDAGPLLDYLPNLPPFTRLLFVEDRALKTGNPALKAVHELPNGYAREFVNPDAREVPGWVAHRAGEKGVAISRSAASLLAGLVGEDLRAADLELEKLAAYAGYARAIEVEDVQSLVSAAQETNIFDLVDSLGLRQRQRALDLLQGLLAGGANELYVLTMFARQVRLIIAVKDLKESGLSATEIRREAGVSHQFIADKLLKQAEQFDTSELTELISKLVEVDEAIKTGRIEGGLALEMLTLDICQRRSPEADHQANNSSRAR